MSDIHRMICEKTEDGLWQGWLDAFSTTRVEAATNHELEEALELGWAKLLTRKIFESDPSERTGPLAIMLVVQVDD